MVDLSVEADSTYFRVWLTTDWHLNNTNDYYVGDPTAYDVVTDFIDDSENDWGFEWDIAIVIGDVTNNGLVAQYGEVLSSISDSVVTHNRADFYITAGNHDVFSGEPGGTYFDTYIDNEGDDTGSSGVYTSSQQFTPGNISNYEADFTLEIGNTVFICFSPLFSGSGYADYGQYSDWWYPLVNTMDSNKNILCCTHHPVENSGLTTVGDYLTGPYDTWMSQNSGRIDAWFNGHAHYADGRVLYNTMWGTFFLNACGVDDADSTSAAKSIVLEFEVGSTTVHCYDYFHGDHGTSFPHSSEQWDGDDSNRGNLTFILNNTFSFSGGGDSGYDAPVINHMGYPGSGGLGNMSVMVDDFWVNFTWNGTHSGVPAPSSYWIKFYNDSSGTDEVFDISFYHVNYVEGNYVNLTYVDASNLGARTDKYYINIEALYG